jgi:hypothetical protein
MVDETRLADLNAGAQSPADFHPMFLQKWFDNIGAAVDQNLSRNIQLSDFRAV